MAAIPRPGEVFHSEDGTVSTVLPDSYDPNYNPPQEELEEYAEYIGIDLDKEPQLMWVATEGLRTPLPAEWRACQTGDGDVYYFNFESGESLWDHPMDEIFKEKVMQERVKLQRGGGGGGASRVSGIMSGPSTTTGAKRTGSTKAIANSLFIGEKNPPGGTGALQKVSAPSLGARGIPDVSDILQPPPLSSTRRLGLSSPAVSPVDRGPVGSKIPGGPINMKDMEANIRKRAEEEFAAERRSLHIQLDRELIEERAKLEKALEVELAALKSVAEGTKAGKNGGAIGTSALDANVAKEAAGIEASWVKRIDEVQKNVTSLRALLSTKKAQAEEARGQTLEQLKAILAEKHAAAVAQKTEMLATRLETEVKQIEVEQTQTLEELKRLSDATQADALKKAEEENAMKLATQEAQAKKMIETLEATIEKMRNTCQEKRKAATSALTAAPQPAAGSAAAMIEKAEEEAAEDLAKARAAHAQHMKKVKTDFSAKRVKAEAEATKAASTKPTSAGDVSTTSNNSSVSKSVVEAVVSLSDKQSHTLQEEERHLKQELESAKAMYSAETEKMMKGILGVSASDSAASFKGAGTTSASSHGGTPTSTMTPTTMTATHELRLRDAENTRHAMALKQIEAKHEQTMRQLRDTHQKTLASRVRFDARKIPAYASTITTMKREWLAQHPAPSQAMPILKAIPKINSMAMMEMPAVDMPDEEDQKMAIAVALQKLRAQDADEQESQLSAFEAEMRQKLEKLKTTYREQRLTEVGAIIEAEKKKLAASAAATHVTAAVTSSSTSAASAPTDASLTRIKEAMTREASAHAARVASLKAQIARVEEDGAAVTALLREQQQQQRQHISSVRMSSATPPPPSASTSPAAPSLLSKKAENVTVVEEPDYVLYVDAQVAESELAALHARWHSVLSDLRSSLQQEITSYECLLAQASVASTTAISKTAVMNKKPPTVPTYAGNVSITFSTPVKRPGTSNSVGAREDDEYYYAQQYPVDEPGGGAGGGQQSLIASSIRPTSAYVVSSGQRMQARDVYSMSGGSTSFTTPNINTGQQPLRNNYDVSEERMSGAGGAGPLLTPVPFSDSLLQSSVRQSPIVQMQNTTAVVEAGPEASRRSVAFERRLASLRETLRTRRRELRAQQQHLESLREEWRSDMRECKQAHSKKEAMALRRVKEALEAEARQLNTAVVNLKEASRRLAEEELRYKIHTASAIDEGAAAAGSVEVLGLLRKMLVRTERLESLIHKQRGFGEESNQTGRRRTSSLDAPKTAKSSRAARAKSAGDTLHRLARAEGRTGSPSSRAIPQQETSQHRSHRDTQGQPKSSSRKEKTTMQSRGEGRQESTKIHRWLREQPS